MESPSRDTGDVESGFDNTGSIKQYSQYYSNICKAEATANLSFHRRTAHRWLEKSAEAQSACLVVLVTQRKAGRLLNPFNELALFDKGM